MNFDDVKVVAGNRAYMTNYFDLYSDLDESYPRIVVDATISPENVTSVKIPIKTPNDISIKNVIFNNPATIIFWSDNTKTVVKCDTAQEDYDPEKGIAMAIAKKMLGDNKYEYYNIFLHWLKKYYKQM